MGHHLRRVLGIEYSGGLNPLAPQGDCGSMAHRADHADVMQEKTWPSQNRSRVVATATIRTISSRNSQSNRGAYTTFCS